MLSGVAHFLSQHWLDVPAFLFVITIVVFFHELGHFAVARLCRVTVHVFSIGFGKELVGWTDRKGTRWRLSVLPFGGYVKFAGDADVSSTTPDEEAVRNAGQEERAGMLHFKPLYQRAAVAAAGPIANFILAIVIFASIFMTVGRQVTLPIVDGVVKGSAAEEAGVLPNDRIVSVDGQGIQDFSDIQLLVAKNVGQPMDVVVDRADKEMTLRIAPRMVEDEDPLNRKVRAWRLGLESKDPAHKRIVRYGLPQAIWLGVKQTWSVVDQTLSYLGQVVTQQRPPDQLRGPVGILDLSGKVAQLGGLLSLIGLAGLLSVSIGLINLFPIPVLDGGHLLYYACEAVLGRPLGERAQEVGFRLGLALVLCLMLLATFNDLIRNNLF